ncbi:MAG: hypothetical protein KAI53_00800 [Candidatus Aenigmarchaeota archaeon]|nr:hypothetical protein [Candidatus Aenigmarchaeota archaeon]
MTFGITSYAHAVQIVEKIEFAINNVIFQRNTKEYDIRENDGYIEVQSPVDLNLQVKLIESRRGNVSKFNNDVDFLMHEYNSTVSKINKDMKISAETVKAANPGDEDEKYIVLKIPLKAENLDECVSEGSKNLAELYKDIYIKLT